MRIATVSTLFVLALALGCASGHPIVMPDSLQGMGTIEETRAAVFDGIYRRDWVVEEERPLSVLARLELRTHTAKAWIDYDADRVSFRYGGSKNLGCKPQGDGCSEIHGNYNRWVRNLGISIGASIAKTRALRDGVATRTTR
ncbi:MAG: hypothetical protein QNK05_04400 [Myxococcota bacterium]|nr:hypothetical protein [Myxococcota bacterium]